MREKLCFGALVLVLMFAAVASPVSADEIIFTGDDFWYTPAGGAKVNINIPAGLFCGGASPAMAGVIINLKHLTPATNPAGSAGNADTVVRRLADAPFALSADTLSTTTSLKIGVLSLVSSANLVVNCPGGVIQMWEARVGLRNPQNNGTINIRRPFVGAPGGRFDASFPVKARIRFRNVASGAVTGWLNDDVTITTLDACWTHLPCPGSILIPAGVVFDSNADGTPDWATIGNSNFFPGCEVVGGVYRQCPTVHTGPHPVTCTGPGSGCPEQVDPNPCTADIRTTLASNATRDGFVLSDEEYNGTVQRVSASQINEGVTFKTLKAQQIDQCIAVEGLAIHQQAFSSDDSEIVIEQRN